MSDQAILAIDPGTFESAYVRMTRDQVYDFAKVKNEFLLEMIEDRILVAEHLALEMLDARGKPLGYETLRTLVWCGQFVQAFGRLRTTEINRSRVQIALCGNMKDGRDSSIRQVIIDRYGGNSVAIGGVKCGGCKGKGIAGNFTLNCPECSGTGNVSGARGPKKCPMCKGRSIVKGGPMACATCNGSTWKFPPGPLHGFTKDCWQALAVGCTWFDLQ